MTERVKINLHYMQYLSRANETNLQELADYFDMSYAWVKKNNNLGWPADCIDKLCEFYNADYNDRERLLDV